MTSEAEEERLKWVRWTTRQEYLHEPEPAIRSRLEQIRRAVNRYYEQRCALQVILFQRDGWNLGDIEMPDNPEVRRATIRANARFMYAQSPDHTIEFRVRQIEDDVERYTIQKVALLELMSERNLARLAASAVVAEPAGVPVVVAPTEAEVVQQVKKRGRPRKVAA